MSIIHDDNFYSNQPITVESVLITDESALIWGVLGRIIYPQIGYRPICVLIKSQRISCSLTYGAKPGAGQRHGNNSLTHVEVAHVLSGWHLSPPLSPCYDSYIVLSELRMVLMSAYIDIVPQTFAGQFARVHLQAAKPWMFIYDRPVMGWIEICTSDGFCSLKCYVNASQPGLRLTDICKP